MDRPITPPWWRRAGRVWPALGLCGLLAAIGAAIALAPSPGSLRLPAAQIETSPVERAPFQDYLPVRAQAAPLKTVFVSAVAGGEVKQVFVQDGARVAGGRVLASLENPQLELDVTSREADIAGRLDDASAQQLVLEHNQIDEQKQIAQSSYDLLKARHDFDIRRQLHAEGFVSAAQLKTYADAAAYYQGQLATLMKARPAEDAGAVRQAGQIRLTGQRLQNNLEVVRQSLGALMIRAPVAGRLTGFALLPGQALKAGDQVGEIDSEGAYKLTADIDEFYLGRVAAGQRASAQIDGASVPLIVARVLPQVTDGRFRAELTFDGPQPANLRRGQSVDARITLGDTRPALVVANGSWLDASGGSFAFVVDPGGHSARRRPISVGRRNPEEVEITAGLRPGERIVTSSYAGLARYERLIF